MIEQPHFDDELTILTARPVVPLEAIEEKVRSRRRWFLGAAFAVAMMLGAASALLSAYFKMQAVPEADTESVSVESVSPVSSVSSVLEQPIESPSPIVEVTPQPAKHVKPRPRNTDNTDQIMISEPDAQLSEKEQLRRIRDSVLVDEWQERRMRRVTRRERRRAQHNDRDLSNLDEIFEGRRGRP